MTCVVSRAARVEIKPAVWFDDLGDCETGGSWKSSVSTACTYTRGMKRAKYAVRVTHLAECLKLDPTVVKADIEGSEMSVLLDTVAWGNCKLLFFEYSVARCRRFGLGWRPFAVLLDKLLAGGWTHTHVTNVMYDPKFWKAGASSFTESMDSTCFCFRACDVLLEQPLRQQYVQELRDLWRSFRACMNDATAAASA